MPLASPARALRLTGAAIALAAMASCGSGSKSSGDSSASTAAPTVEATTVATTTAATTVAPTTAAATTTTAASATTAAGGAGTSVAVTESEFKIDLPSTNLTAGTYTFAITNAGQFKHSLVVEGPGVDQQKSDLVNPGSSGSLTVTLQPGTYEVYCGVPTHKGKGMDVSITVA